MTKRTKDGLSGWQRAIRQLFGKGEAIGEDIAPVEPKPVLTMDDCRLLQCFESLRKDVVLNDAGGFTVNLSAYDTPEQRAEKLTLMALAPPTWVLRGNASMVHMDSLTFNLARRHIIGALETYRELDEKLAEERRRTRTPADDYVEPIPAG